MVFVTGLGTTIAATPELGPGSPIAGGVVDIGVTETTYDIFTPISESRENVARVPAPSFDQAKGESFGQRVANFLSMMSSGKVEFDP